jgi:cytochrome c oxidase subunit 3
MPNYGLRLRHARLALAIFMTPILMLFISFTVVYLQDVALWALIPPKPSSRRGSGAPSLTLLIANTVALLLSTVTIDLARRAITREAALAPIKSIPESRWATNVRSVAGHHHNFGMLFLAGQLFAWRQLSISGFHLLGGTSSSFIYILTAMHGIHLAGGILALSFANVAAVMGRPVESRRIIVDITAWYWHFMTGLWIYILALFSFAAR